MSARYLQARKPVPSEEYKRVGVIILTTLAVNGAPGQSIDVPTLNSTEHSGHTDGVERRAQRHDLNTESNTASSPQPEGTSSPPGLTDDVMLGDGPLTEQGHRVCKTPSRLEDGESSPLAQSGEAVESEQFILAHPETTPESEPSVVASVLKSDFDNISKIIEKSSIQDDFHKAALCPLLVSEAQSEGEDSQAKKSVELGIPRFLNPTNKVKNPGLETVRKILTLYQENEFDQAFDIMRAHFSGGEFEKHLFSAVREQMFYWSTQRPSPGSKRLPKLVYYYALETQHWCASVFDATVRRVKFAIDPLKACLSVEDPITGEIKCCSKADLPSDLAKDIAKTGGWLEGYLQAEPKFRTAVNRLKNILTEGAYKEWAFYKMRHSLTSRTTRTRKLEQPLRSKTLLMKNTHFISWYLRRITPACFLFDRWRIADAIRAIEGETSVLAKVVDNLCVPNLAAFKKAREMLEQERFHCYVKVPQEFEEPCDDGLPVNKTS